LALEEELVDSGKDGTVNSGREVIVNAGGDEGEGDVLKELRLWLFIGEDFKIAHSSLWPDLPFNVQLPPGPVLFSQASVPRNLGSNSSYTGSGVSCDGRIKLCGDKRRAWPVLTEIRIF